MYIYRYQNYEEKREMTIMTVRILAISTGRGVMTREKHSWLLAPCFREGNRGTDRKWLAQSHTCNEWQQLMFILELILCKALCWAPDAHSEPVLGQEYGCPLGEGAEPWEQASV